MTVVQQVTDALNVLNVLVVLVALFTSTQSAAVEFEADREGGGRKGPLHRIATLSLALAIISLAAFASIVPVAKMVADAHGTHDWEATFYLFLLVWVLLVPLSVWQLAIAVRAIRMPQAPAAGSTNPFLHPA